MNVKICLLISMKMSAGVLMGAVLHPVYQFEEYCHFKNIKYFYP